MPLYEFHCNTCGPFEQWRTLAEASSPLSCPTCEHIARRVFSPPSVMLSSTLRLRNNHDLEPQLVRRSQESIAPRVQSHRHGRPWMINH